MTERRMHHRVKAVPVVIHRVRSGPCEQTPGMIPTVWECLKALGPFMLLGVLFWGLIVWLVFGVTG